MEIGRPQLCVCCSLLLYDMKPWKATWKKRPLVKMRLKGDPAQLLSSQRKLCFITPIVCLVPLSLFSIFIKSAMDVMNRVTNALSEASCVKMTNVLQVHFKNELVLVLVHFTKKRTFCSFLVLWEKVN